MDSGVYISAMDARRFYRALSHQDSDPDAIVDLKLLLSPFEDYSSTPQDKPSFPCNEMTPPGFDYKLGNVT